MKVRDHVVSLKSTGMEQQLALTLGVGLHQFIGERNCMLIGFTRAAFKHYAVRTGNSEVTMASQFNDEMLKEYFSSRPGMAKADGLAIYSKACTTYYAEDSDKIGTKFLANVAEGMLASQSLTSFPQFQQYIHLALKESLSLVQLQVEKLLKNRH